MTRLAFCLALLICANLPAQPRPAAATTDVIQRKDGTKLTGVLVRRTATTVEVRSQISGDATASVSVPISTIARITFANSSRSADQLARIGTPELLKIWRAEGPFIDLPESAAGAVGLQTVRRLLDDPDYSDPKMAAQILEQITTKDWDATHRDHARVLALGVLRLTGKRADVTRSAAEVLSGNAGPEIKAEASYYAGLALIDDYRDFLRENPRWDLDPRMKPEHSRLYNEALDALLAPYLRYGAPPAVTAKSLLAAVTFLSENGESTAAEALAGDVVTIFGDQPEAEGARKFLGKK